MEFPAQGTPRQKLHFAMKCAAFAPKTDRRQSLQFSLAGERLEIFSRNASASAMLEHADRETMINCGATLEYVWIVLRSYGGRGRVDLFPNFDQPALVARVLAGWGCFRDVQAARLFAAMKTSLHDAKTTDSSRCPIVIPDLICSKVTRSRSWLEFAQSKESRRRLAGLVADPQVGESTNELTVPNARSSKPTRLASGCWHEHLSRWARPLLTLCVRAQHDLPPASANTRVAHVTGSLAVIKSKTDDKHGWLAAGRTLTRLILNAQALGLSWSLYHRALCDPERRSELRTGIGHKGFVQAILKLGAHRTEDAGGNLVPAGLPASMALTPRQPVYPW